jgi:hypothetical protein
MKEYDPSGSYSTCLVLVPDVLALRQAFVTGLRTKYGKLPSSGIPRLTPLRDKADGGRGFNIIDPGGNWIRISQHQATIESELRPTALNKAIHAASLLADSKGDYAGAVKVLDRALTKYPEQSKEWVQAMVARAELALTMGDDELARKLVADIRHENAKWSGLEDELRRIEDVEQAIE